MADLTHSQLKKNVLTTWDIISQSLAFLGPVMSMAFLTAYIAISAGAATPLAVFLGGLTMIALGYVIAQFASRVHAAGAIYNYVTKAFGPEIGFVGGWMYMACAVVFAVIFPPTAGATPAYTTEFGYFSGIGAIAIEVIYILVSLAAIVWFRRELRGEYSVVKHLFVPVVAMIGAGAALYGSLQPPPDPLLQTMPYVALALIIIGLIYIMLLRVSRPGLVAQIGRDLSEMEAPEPVDMRFSHDLEAG